MTLRDAAQQYRALGLHPIPLEPGGKRPLLPSWKPYQETQPSEAEIDAWWAATPDANVGLVLGRDTFALDVDGPVGWAALGAAGLTFADLLGTASAAVVTGKGHHLYFRGQVPDRIGLLDRVDVRGVGYVVAPPSVHPSGRVYEWIGGVRPFPPAPAKLLALIRREPAKPASTASPSWVAGAWAGVGEGLRDVTCTRLAGYLWGKGLPQDVIEAMLQAWAGRCVPAFEPEQVTKCVESIVQRDGGPTAPPSILRTLVGPTLAELEAGPEVHGGRLVTGFTKLDEVLVALGSELVYLGARPSVGKTAFALHLARKWARENKGVLFVTREMTRTQLVRRLLAMEASVPLQDLKAGALLDHQKTMLRLAAERLSLLPLWITHDVRSPAALAEVLRAYEPGEVRAVFVDYLQLLRSDVGTRDSRQRVEECSQGLKDIVVKFDVPVICLSSLSRPPKDRPGWVPRLSDLRESGELEHDADSVWLMHRDPPDPAVQFQVAKNRDGALADLTLRFDAPRMQWEEPA